MRTMQVIVSAGRLFVRGAFLYTLPNADLIVMVVYKVFLEYYTVVMVMVVMVSDQS